MAKLEVEKVDNALQWLTKHVDVIGKENIEGLLVAINTKNNIDVNIDGSAKDLEEMLVAAVAGLIDTEFYSQFPAELAVEMICHEIKMQILSKGGFQIANQ